MKALITGISGRVGANLAHQMKVRGYEICGLVMPNDPHAAKAERLGVEIVEADLADAERVRAAADGVDVIVHLGAQIPQGTDPSERMLDVNTRATMSLLEGALTSSVPLKRFLLASTYQTYNPFITRDVTFDENTAQQPIDIYALTKLLSEEICLSYMREYGTPVTILRYCSIKAANEVLGMLHPAWLNYFIEMTLSKNRVPWFGAEHIDETKAIMSELLKTPDAVCAVRDADGKPWQLVVTDVRDVAAGTILALESEAAVGEAFNMTGCPPISYPSAARLLADATGRPYRDVQMPFWRGAGASTEKARALLGYDPQWSFDRMVETALAYERGQPIDQIPY
ncbi:MAG: NAD(P)-dependent oxidoreductase [Chloroflexi bacterium]|nr:NAD(P)-dependent oxidoreductase [Chloroflexota bacterium]